MLKDRKDIDAVFKEGLEGYSISAPDYVWDSIEASLIQKNRMSRSLIFWRATAAACIAVLMIVSIRILFRSSEQMVSEPLKMSSIESRVETEKGQNKNIISKEYSPIENEIPELVENIIVPINESKSIYKTNDDLRVDGGNLQELMVGKTNVNFVKDYEISAKLHSKKAKVYYPLYASNFNTKKTQQATSISIGGLLSPAYSSKTSSGSNVEKASAYGVQVNESGINSLGGGLQVRIKRGSRWSFETGVLYAQVGQEVYNSMPENMAEMHVFASSLSTSNQMYLSNSMGNIVVNNAVRSDFSYDNANQLAENNITANMPYSEGVKQTLEYIEIPLITRYSLFKEFPYLSLAGGISSNFLVGNNAYAINDDYQQEIGKTENIKSFVISSSIGLGIDVPIGKVLNFSLEPRFKYFLNSVSSDPDYGFQPYSFGIYGGITFVVK